MRFSPDGFPLKPYVAKKVEVSPDNRTFTVTLRRGMRWSDGDDYNADDLVYWWEHEQNDEIISPGGPWPVMRINGRPGDVERVDDYTIRFTFPEPNGSFLMKMAGGRGWRLTGAPSHYVRQYHPSLGNNELIEKHMAMRKNPMREALYRADIRHNRTNPACPHLWPWVYRRHQANPPQRVVRNPYYFAVDMEGNQLPYVDEIVFAGKQKRMQPLSCANGEVTFQHRALSFEDYTMLMDNREKHDYQVFHWYPGTRSWYTIYLNQVRVIEQERERETTWKQRMLRNRTFRQALSLAINRRRIIKAEYYDLTEPANDLPGPASPFHDPEAYYAHTQYDPKRAGEMLDSIGLDQRDIEGYRTFPDGTRMVFFLDYTDLTGYGPTEFVVDDWAAVGLRVVPRERSGTLFSSTFQANLHDMCAYAGAGRYYPMTNEPLPPYATWGYLKWYHAGGMQDSAEKLKAPYAIAPPEHSPVRDAFRLFGDALAESDVERQAAIYKKLQWLIADQQWTINISSPTPVLAVVKNGLRNVPHNVVAAGTFSTPANAGMETFYFEEPETPPETAERIARDILEPKMPPNWPMPEEVMSEPAEAAPEEGATAETEAVTTEASDSGGFLQTTVTWLVRLIILALLIMIAVRHPYVGRRLLIMVPTLLIVSVVVFVVIQLPPGTYLDTELMRLQALGDHAVAHQYREGLEKMFWLDEPMAVRYVRWLGLYWFRSFDDDDRGLLQGHMGRTMEHGHQPVNELVGDRIVLTVAVSFGTILFTYAMSIPIGIYSAVKQYSIGDYVLTTIGFIGLCVPPFLLALLVMYASDEWFGLTISGLFSPEYAAQIGWSWGKVADLLKHIWVPILVMGVTGTAGGIRTMRANLLDELKRPYVVTARAKGVHPLKLLIKYPVRLALNPFVSGIGNLFPRLVSGGALVGIVMSLPMVGPLLLEALMTQDMYLAGSMLMVLSLLTVLGTLVSDLLLLGLDPRIRFEAGTR